MPTVPIAGYAFRFYSSDRTEPPHMHVFRGGASAKVWLLPVAVAYNAGFSPTELNRVVKLTQWWQSELLEAWNAHFDG